MGGPTAKRLIEKHDLRPALATVVSAAPSAALATDVASEDERFISDSPRFVKGFMLLLLAVGIGNQVSVWLTALTGLTFPAYIGAMLVAVVVRNVMDGVHVSYPAEEIDTMGNMFLSIFLAMALAGLKLWELVDLAMPMVGGMFIDFFNAVLIAANIGWWT
jgi:ESS family glutamate:Na+ symporter